MKKRLLLACLACVLLVLICVSCGKKEEVPGEFEFTFRADGSYILSSVGTVKSANIEIPTSYNNLPVSEIGADAFANCTFIKTVSIPSTVDRIGRGAFSGCTNLKNILIPASVKSVGSLAFDDTGYEKNEANWQGDMLVCGDWLLEVRKITTGTSGVFTVPDTITKLADSAFYGCAGLTEIVLPGTLRAISAYAFGACVSLQKINMPSSLESIGSSAFMSCTALTALTIPQSVRSIGNFAFYSCEALKITCNFTSSGALFGNESDKVSLGLGWDTDVGEVQYFKLAQ